MAITRLTDVFYGPLFLDTTIQRTAITSVLRQSGITSNDPEIQRFANGPGDIVQMPFWNDLIGDSNVSTDDTQAATPLAINQGQDFARKIRRNIGFGAANLVAAVLAEDPLDVVAQLIADYWAREEQKILIAILDGVFASASMSPNELEMAVETTAGAVEMNSDIAANAHALLGEQGVNLTAVAMHSRVYWNLVADNNSPIVYAENPTNQGTFDIPTWQGKRVIVSDQLPRRAGTTSGFVYTSYFFGEGAIAYAEAQGEGGPKIPVELESAPSQGKGEGLQNVWYRRHFVMHPRGVKFTSTTLAGNSPTNAELALAANWSLVYDPKNVRIVRVTTNG